MVACIASVSVWFWSKERPRNGILGFGRARNEARATPLFYLRHLTLVPRSLLLNRTETLAMQAGHAWPFRIVRSDRQWYWVPHSVVRRHNNQRDDVVAWVLSPREERVALPLFSAFPSPPLGGDILFAFPSFCFYAMDYCIFFSTQRLFSVCCCNILILSMLWSRDELREHLKNAPKMIMAQQRAAASDSDSDSSDDSSGEGGSERANSFDWLFLLSCESKPHLPWAVDAIFSAVRIMLALLLKISTIHN